MSFSPFATNSIFLLGEIIRGTCWAKRISAFSLVLGVLHALVRVRRFEISILITAVLITLTIPFAARFGMTRALRYIPLGFAALVILGICFLWMMPGEEMVSRFEYFASNQIALATVATLMASVAIFALCTFGSVALYRRRQF